MCLQVCALELKVCALDLQVCALGLQVCALDYRRVHWAWPYPVFAAGCVFLIAKF